MTLAVAVGDRVRVRDRVWRVARLTTLAQAQVVLEIESVGGDGADRLSVVAPPEEVERLPGEALHFEPRGFDAFLPWSANLRLLTATLTRETGLVTGARFGRVALEAYQLAQILRLLAKPRASLLVADDVGLGKTIEAGLAMLEMLARQRVRRILVVAPPGLLLQWKDELFETFGFAFILIENATGLAREQARLPAGASPWDMLGRVITSIDFLKKETVRKRAIRKRWDLVIVDEAHSVTSRRSTSPSTSGSASPARRPGPGTPRSSTGWRSSPRARAGSSSSSAAATIRLPCSAWARRSAKP